MSSRTTVTAEDEGKPIVIDGDTVGRIVSVEGGTAYIAPDPSLTETVFAKLGWEEPRDDDYPLETDSIEKITDEEIRLSSPLE